MLTYAYPNNLDYFKSYAVSVVRRGRGYTLGMELVQTNGHTEFHSMTSHIFSSEAIAKARCTQFKAMLRKDKKAHAVKLDLRKAYRFEYSFSDAAEFNDTDTLN